MTEPDYLRHYRKAMLESADRFDQLSENERKAVHVYRSLGWRQLVPASLSLARRCERLADEARVAAYSDLSKEGVK